MSQSGTPSIRSSGDLDGQRLLLAVTRAQNEFIADRDPRELFDLLLQDLLELTRSEYGFIGEVLQTPAGDPYLKTHAVTNIAWDAETRRFYEQSAPSGMEFHNLETLFGAVMTTRAPLISNEPATDPRRGGLPAGHPPLRAFLGIPFQKDERLIGLVGIANRPGGYDQTVIDYLAPLLATCASVIAGHRADQARRKAESALRASEQHIQAIVAGAVDAIITIDDAGIIQSANPAATRMFGFTAREMLGNNVRMLMPSPERERHDHHISTYLKTGKRKVIGIGREVLGRRKDGSTLPVHLSISEVASPGRRWFTGILRDITDLKTAQQQLESALALAQRSREHMRAILNQLRLGSMVLGETGKVIFLSDPGRRILGVSGGEHADTHWTRLCRFGREALQQLEQMMDAPADQREKVRVQVDAGAGQRSWIDVEIHDDPRNTCGKIVFMYDMTEVHDLRRQLGEHATFHDLVGKSEPMQQVFHNIVDLAKVDVTVLIEGETGTGKELVARAIHSASKRKDQPFLAVNCAGLSDSLLSSQLFGHRRGAFTGAIADHAGIFEAAAGGTVFLDEIGDVSADVQRSLLRVLQEREITRLGESKPRKVDVRVIAATHRDLKEEVARGEFRMDLLYRVRVAPIQLPPLRERRVDIPLLAATFLREACAGAEKKIDHVSSDALAALMDHDWPGNVRELQNAIYFAVVRCTTPQIRRQDLPVELVAHARAAELSTDPIEAERQSIQAALRAARGNRAAAARNLGMSRATFYRRLADLGIEAKSGK